MLSLVSMLLLLSLVLLLSVVSLLSVVLLVPLQSVTSVSVVTAVTSVNVFVAIISVKSVILTGETHDASSRHQTQREIDIESEQDAADGPAVVVYMVDPFSYASDADDLRRLAMLGLLRCYNEMLRTLPPHVHHNVHLQVGVTSIPMFSQNFYIFLTIVETWRFLVIHHYNIISTAEICR